MCCFFELQPLSQRKGLKCAHPPFWFLGLSAVHLPGRGAQLLMLPGATSLLFNRCLSVRFILFKNFENFFRFAPNICLDSSMNLLDFGDQMSNSL